MNTVFILIWNIIALGVMMGAGYWLHQKGYFSTSTSDEIANLIINIFYPCLIFVMIVEGYTLAALKESWCLPVGLFGMTVASLGVGWVFRRWARANGMPEAQGKTVHYQSGFNNYSFLPIPLAIALWGEIGGAMVMCCSLGAEIATWTFGVSVLSGDRVHPSNLLKMICRPTMLALLFSILVVAFRDLGYFPPAVMHWVSGVGGTACLRALRMMGSVAIPLFMLVAGSIVAGSPRQIYRLPILWWSVISRNLLIPAILLLLLAKLPWPVEYLRVLRLIAVMPASVMGITMIRVYGGDHQLAAANVLLTHILAVVSAPLLLIWVL